ncbi:MAG: beta-N-acetylhexosaminidase [gamma proteobacterium symbiont of Taylorina sp.]|nr:beta-N-acetylhexosaminidase [gamma proteobacterium symbiont of Taylorina sp.]
MTLGPVMVDIAGQELTADDRHLLSHPAVGGVILFSRNYHSLDQLEKLVQSIQLIKSPRLLIAVDQEGGRVQRFKDGFTILPAMRCFGEVYDSDHKLALDLAQQCGWLMASEIRSAGIDISFAPVLDIDKGISSVIGDRAFHHDPFVVGKIAQAFVKGMDEAGMQATGKHFPGHGSIAADSHIAMPIDERSMVDIEMNDLRPFQFMIEAGLNALMMAHVIYSRVDSQPAGFSSFWMKTMLRDKMHFQGAIFSDDLSMEGAVIAGSYIQRAKISLDCGCDMVLVCNNRAAAWEVVHSLESYADPASSLRLAHLHGKQMLTRETLVNEPRWKEAKKILDKYVEEPSLNLLDPINYHH